MQIDSRGLPISEQRKMIKALQLIFSMLSDEQLADFDRQWERHYKASFWFSPLEHAVSQQLQSEWEAQWRAYTAPLE